MRSLIMALVFVVTLTGCDNQSSQAHWRAQGVVSVSQGAPYCMIYVGLKADERASFNRAFWDFAYKHDLRKPRLHPISYSGPPMAAAMNDHVAVYVDYSPTPDIVERHKIFSKAGMEEPHSWVFASIGGMSLG